MPFPMQRGYGFERVGGMHRGGGDPLDWVIFALLLLLILLAVAEFAVLVRSRRGGPRHMWRGGHKGPGPWGPPDPLAFARMRYARGEIDRDTYVQLTQDLGGQPDVEPPPPPPASAPA